MRALKPPARRTQNSAPTGAAVSRTGPNCKFAACATPDNKPPTTNDSDTSDWKTYRNEEYGFEVRYPSEWKVEEEERGQYVLITFGPESPYDFLMSITAYQRSSLDILEQYATEITNFIRNDMSDANGRLLIKSTYFNPNNNLEYYEYSFVVGKRGYIFAGGRTSKSSDFATAVTEDGKILTEVFESVFASFTSL